jgi:hypothetical protein
MPLRPRHLRLKFFWLSFNSKAAPMNPGFDLPDMCGHFSPTAASSLTNDAGDPGDDALTPPTPSTPASAVHEETPQTGGADDPAPRKPPAWLKRVDRDSGKDKAPESQK